MLIKITLKTHSVQLLLCITIDKGKQLINGGVFSFYQQLGTKAKSFKNQYFTYRLV